MIKPDKSWSLFLDRDGVINKRIINDYIKNVDEFCFIDGVLESVNELSKIFGKVFVVTNQQGIAKNIMTENDLNVIHRFMCDQINKTGGRIDRVYHCPDLEGTGSKDRKPETGMGLKAKKEFPEIEFEKSVMIGDSAKDIVFGNRLNMFTVLISDEQDSEEFKDIEYNERFSSLIEFKNWLKKNIDKEQPKIL